VKSKPEPNWKTLTLKQKAEGKEYSQKPSRTMCKMRVGSEVEYQRSKMKGRSFQPNESRHIQAGMRVWKGNDHPEHINANDNIMKMNTNGKSRSEPKLKARATIFRERQEGPKLGGKKRDIVGPVEAGRKVNKVKMDAGVKLKPKLKMKTTRRT